MPSDAPRWAGWVSALGLLALASAGCAHGRLPEASAERWAALPRWPQPPDPARVIRVGQIAAAGDVVESRGAGRALVDALAGEATVQGLARPVGVAAAADGRIAVADPGLRAVVVFDPGSGDTGFWRKTPRGPLLSPVGVAVDSQGRTWVTDSAARRVESYDRDGEHLLGFGHEGFVRPTGIAVDEAARELLVVDTGAHTVWRFGLDGSPRGNIGSGGEGPGGLHFPTFLALAPGVPGALWVVDSLNARVQTFGLDGSARGGFGSRGDTAGHFARPKGIARDSQGHLYVTDALFDNVQVFDGQGRLLLVFSGPGAGDDQLSLPAGIAIDSQDRIFVADSHNGRIQIFRYVGEGAHVPVRP